MAKILTISGSVPRPNDMNCRSENKEWYMRHLFVSLSEKLKLKPNLLRQCAKLLKILFPSTPILAFFFLLTTPLPASSIFSLLYDAQTAFFIKIPFTSSYQFKENITKCLKRADKASQYARTCNLDIIF